MAPEAILFSWSWEPLQALGLLLTAAIYWRGWRQLTRQVPDRFPVERLISFFLGLGAIYVALASPLDAFANWLLTVHMVQHLLLTMVAPPLLLLGWPLLPMLSGLPKVLTREAIGPFLTAPTMHKIGRFLVHPLFAGPLFIFSNVAWHVPAAYELALQSTFWHRVEHLCFLTTAILFWWPVVQPWPSRPVWPRWAMIPYLLLADLQNTALAAFLSFYEGVIYSTYANAPRISSLSALDDQAAAGAIMWVPGSIAFLAPVGIIATSYLSSRRKRQNATRQVKPLPRLPARKFDLLRLPVVGPFLRWRHSRRLAQALMFTIALAIILDGLLGPQVSPMNLAGVFPWTYWRGLTVVGLLVAGNLFCMVCPFTFFRDLGRRILPGNLRWPKVLRSKWIAVALLAGLFWAFEFFDLWNSPWWTAWIVIGYFAAALLIDGFFRGASFCKFVCPIGQFHFVSSLVSPLEVRVREPDVCASCRTHDCLKGNGTQRGCELELFQPRKSGNMDCTFCLDCVKACPHDNVGILLASPGRDVIEDSSRRSSVRAFSDRADVATLCGVFTAGAFLTPFAMTSTGLHFREVLTSRWGLGAGGLIVALIYAVVLIVLPAAVARICSLTARVDAAEGWKLSRGFGMAFAPLGFSMWLAHFVFHLLTGSHTAVPVVHRVLADLGWGTMPEQWHAGSLAFAGLPALQILFLNAGVLFTLWILWRKARPLVHHWTVFLPWALVSLALYVFGLWILFQPMALRGMVM